MNAEALEVRLGDVRVGTLIRQQRYHCSFQLDPDYLALAHRPILGQEFEDRNPHRARISEDSVPTWFSHLLPEQGGFLRDVVARQMGGEQLDDFNLLRQMGRDLPGAVRVLPMGWAEHDLEGAEPEHAPVAANRRDGAISFALAGIQAKWSMSRDKDRGLVLQGARGESAWLVKTPDAVYPHACENEFATMRWAEACGITTPPIDLIDTADLHGLPANVPIHAGRAFAIERFDRTQHGRVHQEDFAQVLGRPVQGKYEGTSYEVLAALVLRLCGEEDFDEFLLRLVFCVACGNADAHLKNWSLRYGDGIQARLSPAYDLLSIVAYADALGRQELALPLNGSRAFAAVSARSWRKVARLAEMDEADLVRRVGSAASTVRDTWHRIRDEFVREAGLGSDFTKAVEQHMARVPLLNSSS
ncbi:MAG: type II toxin-antitoxin system HipA family toxin [Deltaproteobacteria bacterium]|nr:type II toxin-antitoxin system HipA family toxin [Deltaproteobacteria bacterium]